MPSGNRDDLEFSRMRTLSIVDAHSITTRPTTTCSSPVRVSMKRTPRASPVSRSITTSLTAAWLRSVTRPVASAARNGAGTRLGSNRTVRLATGWNPSQ